MFTILHQKDGTEAFHSAISVHYHGPFSPRHQTSDSAYFLEIVQEDSTFEVAGGMAYVMNAAGATVGKYFLDPVSAADKPKLRAA
jgi:hypothetical protein